MFVWNKKMYMDEKVRKKPARYKKLAGRKKSFRQCFCITFPANSANILDIYPSREIWFKYQAAKGVEIVGLAAGRDSAIQLVADIVHDIYKKYGDISPGLVKEFFA